MKKDPLHHDPVDILGEAYERMLERAMRDYREVKHKTAPVLHQMIDAARDKAVELEELSREEADKVAKYLKRDLTDAAEYLQESGEEFRDWLGFEVLLLEEKLGDLFMQAADKTTLELLQLRENLARTAEFHTGEVSGPGTLVCSECGENLVFHKPGKIPPCPKCHATVFKRPTQAGDE